MKVTDSGQAHQLTVSTIAELKGSVRKRLAHRGYFALPAGALPGAIEQWSKDTPMLQAADIAAGHAKTLYLDFGLRVVCEEFKEVILNGSMIRDWSQVARPNPIQLRVRK